MNVAVLGWYDYGNCGDESYKIAFPLLFPNHNITFINSIKKIDLSNIDMIVLGGGDIVKKSFINQLKNINLPKIAVSVTLTNDSDLENLSIFDKILVRDVLSFELGKKHHKNIALMPDFSFALEPNRQRGLDIINDKFKDEGKQPSSKKIVVALNSYISYNHDDAMSRDVIAFQKMIHELARMSEKMDTSWIFLPFSVRSPWDDRSPSSWLAERCKTKYYKNLTIYDKLSVQDTLDIISGADAMISSRLHSTIFSTISGIPFVDILHHNKNFGFLKTIGREDWGFWLWQFDAEKIEKLLLEFLLVGGQASDLQQITRTSKEKLKNAAPFILR